MSKKSSEEKSVSAAPATVEVPKTETPKADAPKAEAPKAEAPKAEAPKADAPSALAFPGDPALAAIAAKLPVAYQTQMARFSRPTPESASAALAALPAETRDLMVDLVDKLQSSSDFRPTPVRLFHGVGNDPTRPAKLPPGNFYSAGSVDLGSEMRIAILKVWDTRVLWPPQDAESKAPVCSSIDGKHGDRFGACATCPNLKKKYTEGGCTPQISVWFVDANFTGIYEFVFSKTAFKGGLALKTIAGADKKPWFRWMDFVAEERVEKDKRWFVPKATPVQDKKPENNTTSPELRNVLQQLEAALQLDVFFPRVARAYTREEESEGGSLPADAGVGAPLKADTSDGDFGGANTAL